MARYRSKPREVEAEQWFPHASEVVLAGNPDRLGVYYEPPAFHSFWVETVGGRAIVNPGDYLILERDGVRRYPCTKEEFEARYEPAPISQPASPEFMARQALHVRE